MSKKLLLILVVLVLVPTLIHAQGFSKGYCVVNPDFSDLRNTLSDENIKNALAKASLEKQTTIEITDARVIHQRTLAVQSILNQEKTPNMLFEDLETDQKLKLGIKSLIEQISNYPLENSVWKTIGERLYELNQRDSNTIEKFKSWMSELKSKIEGFWPFGKDAARTQLSNLEKILEAYEKKERIEDLKNGVFKEKELKGKINQAVYKEYNFEKARRIISEYKGKVKDEFLEEMLKTLDKVEVGFFDLPRALLFFGEQQKDFNSVILEGEGMTVGRLANNNLVFSDNFVSGKHARLFLKDGKTHITDLGSTNGVYVKKTGTQEFERINSNTPIELNDGDEVSITPLKNGIIFKINTFHLKLNELLKQNDIEGAKKLINDELEKGQINTESLSRFFAKITGKEKALPEEEIKPEKRITPVVIQKVPASPLDHDNKWASLVGIIPGLTEELERDFKFGGMINEWGKGEYKHEKSTEGGGTMELTPASEEEYKTFQEWKKYNYLPELSLSEAREELRKLKALLSKHEITLEFTENLEDFETNEKSVIHLSSKIKRIRQLLELLPDSILDLGTLERITLGGYEGVGGAKGSAFNSQYKELQILQFALSGPERNLDALVLHESGHALAVSLTQKERDELRQLREKISQSDFFTFDYGLGKEERAGRMSDSLNEFLAESFMHYTLQGEQLRKHIENLEKTKPSAGKAYSELYNFLKQKFDGKEYGVKKVAVPRIKTKADCQPTRSAGCVLSNVLNPTKTAGELENFVKEFGIEEGKTTPLEVEPKIIITPETQNLPQEEQIGTIEFTANVPSEKADEFEIFVIKKISEEKILIPPEQRTEVKEFEFVKAGAVLEPVEGVIALDAGNKQVPGVIDHHHIIGSERAATGTVLDNPQLIIDWHNKKPITKLTSHENPDFDSITSTYLAKYFLQHGEFPEGAEVLAAYVDLVDFGRLPKAQNMENTPYGVMTGILFAYRGYFDPAQKKFIPNNDKRLEKGMEFIDFLLKRIQELKLINLADEYQASKIFENTELNDDIKKSKDYIKQDQESFKQDFERARKEKIILKKETGQTITTNFVFLENPESALFKEYFRGLGYSVMNIYFSKQDPTKPDSPNIRRFVISTDPETKLQLKGLGEIIDKAEQKAREELIKELEKIKFFEEKLEKAKEALGSAVETSFNSLIKDKTLTEQEKINLLIQLIARAGEPRPGYTNADPWYDGRGHSYTIIDTPRTGTAISKEQMDQILSEYSNKNKEEKPEVPVPVNCQGGHSVDCSLDLSSFKIDISKLVEDKVFRDAIEIFASSKDYPLEEPYKTHLRELNAEGNNLVVILNVPSELKDKVASDFKEAIRLGLFDPFLKPEIKSEINFKGYIELMKRYRNLFSDDYLYTTRLKNLKEKGETTQLQIWQNLQGKRKLDELQKLRTRFLKYLLKEENENSNKIAELFYVALGYGVNVDPELAELFLQSLKDAGVSLQQKQLIQKLLNHRLREEREYYQLPPEQKLILIELRNQVQELETQKETPSTLSPEEYILSIGLEQLLEPKIVDVYHERFRKIFFDDEEYNQLLGEIKNLVEKKEQLDISWSQLLPLIENILAGRGNTLTIVDQKTKEQRELTSQDLTDEETLKAISEGKIRINGKIFDQYVADVREKLSKEEADKINQVGKTEFSQEQIRFRLEIRRRLYELKNKLDLIRTLSEFIDNNSPHRLLYNIEEERYSQIERKYEELKNRLLTKAFEFLLHESFDRKLLKLNNLELKSSLINWFKDEIKQTYKEFYDDKEKQEFTNRITDQEIQTINRIEQVRQKGYYETTEQALGDKTARLQFGKISLPIPLIRLSVARETLIQHRVETDSFIEDQNEVLARLDSLRTLLGIERKADCEGVASAYCYRRTTKALTTEQLLTAKEKAKEGMDELVSEGKLSQDDKEASEWVDEPEQYGTLLKLVFNVKKNKAKVVQEKEEISPEQKFKNPTSKAVFKELQDYIEKLFADKKVITVNGEELSKETVLSRTIKALLDLESEPLPTKVENYNVNSIPKLPGLRNLYIEASLEVSKESLRQELEKLNERIEKQQGLLGQMQEFHGGFFKSILYFFTGKPQELVKATKSLEDLRNFRKVQEAGLSAFEKELEKLKAVSAEKQQVSPCSSCTTTVAGWAVKSSNKDSAFKISFEKRKGWIYLGIAHYDQVFDKENEVRLKSYIFASGAPPEEVEENKFDVWVYPNFLDTEFADHVVSALEDDNFRRNHPTEYDSFSKDVKRVEKEVLQKNKIANSFHDLVPLGIEEMELPELKETPQMAEQRKLMKDIQGEIKGRQQVYDNLLARIKGINEGQEELTPERISLMANVILGTPIDGVNYETIKEVLRFFSKTLKNPAYFKKSLDPVVFLTDPLKGRTDPIIAKDLTDYLKSLLLESLGPDLHSSVARILLNLDEKKAFYDSLIKLATESGTFSWAVISLQNRLESFNLEELNEARRVLTSLYSVFSSDTFSSSILRGALNQLQYYSIFFERKTIVSRTVSEMLKNGLFDFEKVSKFLEKNYNLNYEDLKTALQKEFPELAEQIATKFIEKKEEQQRNAEQDTFQRNLDIEEKILQVLIKTQGTIDELDAKYSKAVAEKNDALAKELESQIFKRRALENRVNVRKQLLEHEELIAKWTQKRNLQERENFIAEDLFSKLTLEQKLDIARQIYSEKSQGKLEDNFVQKLLLENFMLEIAKLHFKDKYDMEITIPINEGPFKDSEKDDDSYTMTPISNLGSRLTEVVEKLIKFDYALEIFDQNMLLKNTRILKIRLVENIAGWGGFYEPVQRSLTMPLTGPESLLIHEIGHGIFLVDDEQVSVAVSREELDEFAKSYKLPESLPYKSETEGAYWLLKEIYDKELEKLGLKPGQSLEEIIGKEETEAIRAKKINERTKAINDNEKLQEIRSKSSLFPVLYAFVDPSNLVIRATPEETFTTNLEKYLHSYNSLPQAMKDYFELLFGKRKTTSREKVNKILSERKLFKSSAISLITELQLRGLEITEENVLKVYEKLPGEGIIDAVARFFKSVFKGESREEIIKKIKVLIEEGRAIEAEELIDKHFRIKGGRLYFDVEVIDLKGQIDAMKEEYTHEEPSKKQAGIIISADYLSEETQRLSREVFGERKVATATTKVKCGPGSVMCSLGVFDNAQKVITELNDFEESTGKFSQILTEVLKEQSMPPQQKDHSDKPLVYFEANDETGEVKIVFNILRDDLKEAFQKKVNEFLATNQDLMKILNSLPQQMNSDSVRDVIKKIENSINQNNFVEARTLATNEQFENIPSSDNKQDWLEWLVIQNAINRLDLLAEGKLEKVPTLEELPERTPGRLYRTNSRIETRRVKEWISNGLKTKRNVEEVKQEIIERLKKFGATKYSKALTDEDLKGKDYFELLSLLDAREPQGILYLWIRLTQRDPVLDATISFSSSAKGAQKVNYWGGFSSGDVLIEIDKNQVQAKSIKDKVSILEYEEENLVLGVPQEAITRMWYAGNLIYEKHLGKESGARISEIAFSAISPCSSCPHNLAEFAAKMVGEGLLNPQHIVFDPVDGVALGVKYLGIADMKRVLDEHSTDRLRQSYGEYGEEILKKTFPRVWIDPKAIESGQLEQLLRKYYPVIKAKEPEFIEKFTEDVKIKLGIDLIMPSMDYPLRKINLEEYLGKLKLKPEDLEKLKANAREIITVNEFLERRQEFTDEYSLGLSETIYYALAEMVNVKTWNELDSDLFKEKGTDVHDLDAVVNLLAEKNKIGIFFLPTNVEGIYEIPPGITEGELEYLLSNPKAMKRFVFVLGSNALIEPEVVKAIKDKVKSSYRSDLIPKFKSFIEQKLSREAKTSEEKLLQLNDLTPVGKPYINVMGPDQLVGVRMTDFAPENGLIKTAEFGDPQKQVRETIHFTANSIVTSHEFGDWEGQKFAIIIPYQHLQDRVVSFSPVDFFVLGNYELPEGSYVVGKKEDLQGINLGKARKVEVPSEETTYEFAKKVVLKLGYSLFSLSMRDLNEPINEVGGVRAVSDAVFAPSDFQIKNPRAGLHSDTIYGIFDHIQRSMVYRTEQLSKFLDALENKRMPEKIDLVFVLDQADYVLEETDKKLAQIEKESKDFCKDQLCQEAINRLKEKTQERKNKLIELLKRYYTGSKQAPKVINLPAQAQLFVSPCSYCVLSVAGLTLRSVQNKDDAENVVLGDVAPEGFFEVGVVGDFDRVMAGENKDVLRQFIFASGAPPENTKVYVDENYFETRVEPSLSSAYEKILKEEGIENANKFREDGEKLGIHVRETISEVNLEEKTDYWVVRKEYDALDEEYSRLNNLWFWQKWFIDVEKERQEVQRKMLALQPKLSSLSQEIPLDEKIKSLDKEGLKEAERHFREVYGILLNIKFAPWYAIQSKPYFDKDFLVTVVDIPLSEIPGVVEILIKFDYALRIFGPDRIREKTFPIRELKLAGSFEGEKWGLSSSLRMQIFLNYPSEDSIAVHEFGHGFFLTSSESIATDISSEELEKFVELAKEYGYELIYDKTQDPNKEAYKLHEQLYFQELKHIGLSSNQIISRSEADSFLKKSKLFQRSYSFAAPILLTPVTPIYDKGLRVRGESSEMFTTNLEFYEKDYDRLHPLIKAYFRMIFGERKPTIYQDIKALLRKNGAEDGETYKVLKFLKENNLEATEQNVLKTIKELGIPEEGEEEIEQLNEEPISEQAPVLTGPGAMHVDELVVKQIEDLVGQKKFSEAEGLLSDLVSEDNKEVMKHWIIKKSLPERVLLGDIIGDLPYLKLLDSLNTGPVKYIGKDGVERTGETISSMKSAKINYLGRTYVLERVDEEEFEMSELMKDIPEVMKVYTKVVGRDGKYLGILREYVEGVRLDELIESDSNVITEVINQVRDLRKKLNDRFLTHQDFYARNILLTKEGKIKLIDLTTMVNHKENTEAFKKGSMRDRIGEFSIINGLRVLEFNANPTEENLKKHIKEILQETDDLAAKIRTDFGEGIDDLTPYAVLHQKDIALIELQTAASNNKINFKKAKDAAETEMIEEEEVSDVKCVSGSISCYAKLGNAKGKLPKIKQLEEKQQAFSKLLEGEEYELGYGVRTRKEPLLTIYLPSSSYDDFPEEVLFHYDVDPKDRDESERRIQEKIHNLLQGEGLLISNEELEIKKLLADLKEAIDRQRRPEIRKIHDELIQKGKPAVYLLIKAFSKPYSHRDDTDRHYAIWTLSAFSKINDKSKIPVLIAILKSSKEYSLRQEAAQHLGDAYLETKDERIIPAFLDALKNEELVTGSLISTLGKIKAMEAVPDLIKIMIENYNKDDSLTGAITMNALVEMGDPRAVIPIAELLKSKNIRSWSREQIIGSLAKLGFKEAIPALVEELTLEYIKAKTWEDDRRKEKEEKRALSKSREAAAIALEQLGYDPKELPNELLVKVLNIVEWGDSSDFGVTRENPNKKVIELLEKSILAKGAEIVPELTRVLSESGFNHEARSFVKNILIKMGEPVVPGIIKAIGTEFREPGQFLEILGDIGSSTATDELIKALKKYYSELKGKSGEDLRPTEAALVSLRKIAQKSGDEKAVRAVFDFFLETKVKASNIFSFSNLPSKAKDNLEALGPQIVPLLLDKLKALENQRDELGEEKFAELGLYNLIRDIVQIYFKAKYDYDLSDDLASDIRRLWLSKDLKLSEVLEKLNNLITNLKSEPKDKFKLPTELYDAGEEGVGLETEKLIEVFLERPEKLVMFEEIFEKYFKTEGRAIPYKFFPDMLKYFVVSSKYDPKPFEFFNDLFSEGKVFTWINEKERLVSNFNTYKANEDTLQQITWIVINKYYAKGYEGKAREQKRAAIEDLNQKLEDVSIIVLNMGNELLPRDLKVKISQFLDELDQERYDVDSLAKLTDELSHLESIVLYGILTQKFPVSEKTRDEELTKLKHFFESKPEEFGMLAESIKEYLRDKKDQIFFKNVHDALFAHIDGTFKDWKYKSKDLEALLEEIRNSDKDKDEKERIGNTLAKRVEELWKQNNLFETSGGFTVEFTDDFLTSLRIGQTPLRTCQRCAGGSYNEGLMAYVANGLNKVAVLKDSTGKIVARRIVRLRMTDNKPVMIVERMYYSEGTPISALDEAMILKAQEMGVDIVANNFLTGYILTTPTELNIKSYGGRALHNYYDSRGIGIVKLEEGETEEFSLKNLEIITTSTKSEEEIRKAVNVKEVKAGKSRTILIDQIINLMKASGAELSDTARAELFDLKVEELESKLKKIQAKARKILGEIVPEAIKMPFGNMPPILEEDLEPEETPKKAKVSPFADEDNCSECEWPKEGQTSLYGALWLSNEKQVEMILPVFEEWLKNKIKTAEIEYAGNTGVLRFKKIPEDLHEEVEGEFEEKFLRPWTSTEVRKYRLDSMNLWRRKIEETNDPSKIDYYKKQIQYLDFVLKAQEIDNLKKQGLQVREENVEVTSSEKEQLLTPGRDAIEFVEEEMRPGRLSESGFLGPTESLRDVIEKDAETLKRRGITHKQIGDRLNSLMGQALEYWELLSDSKGYDAEVISQKKGMLIDGFLRVSAKPFHGSQTTPFLSDQRRKIPAHHDFTVENIRTGEKITFSQLMSYLVGEYGFFEGKEVQYRLDPESIIRILELKPDVDYSPKTIKVKYDYFLSRGFSTTDYPIQESYTEVYNNPDIVIDLAPKAKIYVKGDKLLIKTENGFDQSDINEPIIVDGSEVVIEHLSEKVYSYLSRNSEGSKVYELESNYPNLKKDTKDLEIFNPETSRMSSSEYLIKYFPLIAEGKEEFKFELLLALGGGSVPVNFEGQKVSFSANTFVKKVVDFVKIEGERLGLQLFEDTKQEMLDKIKLRQKELNKEIQELNGAWFWQKWFGDVELRNSNKKSELRLLKSLSDSLERTQVKEKSKEEFLTEFK
ncbi:FHA domain-containing protein [Candidatus Woesearchaeota archaeon]|nr:FHA domain-containing protein [Candidatus Woesearchaeota archaeon]